MAFKMKGSPMARNYGLGKGFPKNEKGNTEDKKDEGAKDDRSYWQMAKDEGKQILAGFAGGGNASDPSRGGGTKSYTSGFGKGYTAEEKRQAAERAKK